MGFFFPTPYTLLFCCPLQKKPSLWIHQYRGLYYPPSHVVPIQSIPEKQEIGEVWNWTQLTRRTRVLTEGIQKLKQQLEEHVLQRKPWEKAMKVREFQFEEARKFWHEYWDLSRRDWDRFQGFLDLFGESRFQETTTKVQFPAEMRTNTRKFRFAYLRRTVNCWTGWPRHSVPGALIWFTCRRGIGSMPKEGIPQLNGWCNTRLGSWYTV